ncbi:MULTISPECIES: carboxyl transferase domain-containing protein [Citricoccus]|nr:carboxyl transferase domain-containing protein [Citricoccus sp. K5]VXC20726.1 Carbamoyl-phosphate synthase large subunit [Citricoccus sp. K5]
MPAVLIANRGEVALRIIRAAHGLGLRTVAVYATDDADSAHVGAADEARSLGAAGVAAYLDIDAVLQAGLDAQCDLVHPGYGFLSENPLFARSCAEAGLAFVGPDPEVLDLLGDKGTARGLAARVQVPVLPATAVVARVEEAEQFMASLDGAPVIVKAVAGGGGRGMRIVQEPADLPSALERCRSEAARSFGRPYVYVERYVPRARHVEVQVVGDGSNVVHLGDRDCSIQRRHQKMIEIAPAPFLTEDLRTAMQASAVELCRAVGYRGLGTVEFLVDLDKPGAYFFIEANPRLQVEHGITEEVTGVDLVRTQLRISAGASLAECGLDPADTVTVRGTAVEARVTVEPGGPDRVSRFEAPSGPGIRVETHGFEGMDVNRVYDPLLGKVIVHREGSSLHEVMDELREVLTGFRIEGPHTNLPLLDRLLSMEEVRCGTTTSDFLDALLAPVQDDVDQGERITVASPTQATVVSVLTVPGARVRRGQPLMVLESMKMEQEIPSPAHGTVCDVQVLPGSSVREGQHLLTVESRGVEAIEQPEVPAAIPATGTRDDLQNLFARRARTTDGNRPEAVAKRHSLGKRTARENLAELFDDGAFHEYGSLVVAAQRARRSQEDLETHTPADGLVTAVGSVGATAGRDPVPVTALAYDYTVLAGTQGMQSHRKAERILDLARRRGTPVVIFAEGGGGRPGDTDNQARATGMDLGTFTALGRLNGLVPTVGIASGRCFAGNAAMLGACDVIIATKDANIGLGGPAMIEGGGLGSFTAEEIGPVSVQVPNGVVDVLVQDEREAARTARKYLGYFQGPSTRWSSADQRLLRDLVPEQPRRSFDIRRLIEVLCDEDSTLELRAGFGRAALTILGRIEGRPVGIIANDGRVNGGAIDSDAADKMARFLQLCDAHDLPVLSLCDTPGFMVGPESETRATVRHVSRLLVAAPNLAVPFCCVVIRRSYGLGGQAMAGGSFRTPDAIVAWPTGDIGAMGPEGAARLGYRKELQAIPTGSERDAELRRLTEEYRQRGQAINAASVFEIDDVIDPAETRSWITHVLTATADCSDEPAQRRRIDTW